MSVPAYHIDGLTAIAIYKLNTQNISNLFCLFFFFFSREKNKNQKLTVQQCNNNGINSKICTHLWKLNSKGKRYCYHIPYRGRRSLKNIDTREKFVSVYSCPSILLKRTLTTNCVPLCTAFEDICFYEAKFH